MWGPALSFASVRQFSTWSLVSIAYIVTHFPLATLSPGNWLTHHAAYTRSVANGYNLSLVIKSVFIQLQNRVLL